MPKTFSGPWVTATIDVSEDNDLTDEIDLQDEYQYIEIFIPTMTDTSLTFLVATDHGGTFVTIGNADNTEACGTGGYVAVVEIGKWQFLKIATADAQAADRVFTVRGFNVG